MKILYLVRHAKSSWKETESLTDAARPLNKRGERDAPFMGNILQGKGVFPQLLISSPALRAYSTALEIAKAINYPQENIRTQERIYGASASDMLRLIQDLDDNHQSVMLFGHNPTFTDLANLFSEEKIENVPTCGILCILFDVSTWSAATAETAQLLWFEYPKLYLK